MLNKMFTKEKTQSIIDVIPDKMVVWKICINPLGIRDAMAGTSTTFQKKWFSLYGNEDGPNYVFSDQENVIVNGPGFHSFVKEGACKYLLENTLWDWTMKWWVNLSAKIHKKDIIGIGNEVGMFGLDAGLCIVTSRIWMPSYPNKCFTGELQQSSKPIEKCVRAMELMEV